MTETEIKGLAERALNAGCALIQQALGITSGDTAAAFFAESSTRDNLEAYIRRELRGAPAEPVVDSRASVQALLTSIAGQAAAEHYVEQDDKAHFARHNVKSRPIRERILIERAILRMAMTDIYAAGHTVIVDYQEEEVRCSSVLAAMQALGECDEEWIHIIAEGPKRLGSIYVVYGNSGWDVISDYHTNLETLLTGANDLATEMGKFID
ncbi:hypothetical protein [Cupriavidus metallidurans]